ncbi:hypothetical protein [Bremerella alba]|uniref:hypothetical protein n=1 Tax=Bremerella alba TaxID=980252 RepID=UPI001A95466B|nr:hypothetical protein [Bremerella alba]
MGLPRRPALHDQVQIAPRRRSRIVTVEIASIAPTALTSIATIVQASRVLIVDPMQVLTARQARIFVIDSDPEIPVTSASGCEI